MNNDLESRNIIISSVEVLTWGLKITCEKGLKFNVPKFKKDTENKTVAYATLEAYPENGLNLNKCFKFVTVPNNQGGQSRYVRIISEPEEGGKSSYVSPAMDNAKPVTIEKENVNWDDVNFGKCKHQFLLEAFKHFISKDDGGIFSINTDTFEKEAEVWATMSMRKLDTAKEVAKQFDGEVVDEIEVENIPF